MLCRFWWNPLSGITKQLLIFDSVLVPLGCWSQRSNPCPANSHNYSQFHSCIKATPKTRRRRRRSNINNKQQTQGCWTQMFSLFGFSLGAFERRNSWFSSKWLFGACCYQNQVWSSLSVKATRSQHCMQSNMICSTCHLTWRKVLLWSVEEMECLNKTE